MSVCPECNDPMTQQKDKWAFKCKSGHKFKLVKMKDTFTCKTCGKDFNPLTYRVGWNAVKCPYCGSIFNYDFYGR